MCLMPLNKQLFCVELRMRKLRKMALITLMVSAWVSVFLMLFTNSNLHGYASALRSFANDFRISDSVILTKTLQRFWWNYSSPAINTSSHLGMTLSAMDIKVSDPNSNKITMVKYELSQSSSSSAPKYPINVLLLAYQRSGSSVMGEILSAHPNASYFFEPLIEITCKRQISDRDGILSALKRIYQCDSNTLEMIGRSRKAVIKLIRKLTHKPHDVNKPSKACLESQIRVIKTIRLRLNWAKDLLDDENLNLKIIHLVRDPRAILHSVAKSETWSDQARTSEYQCSNIRNDLETGIDLPKDRYMRVRYEDFVDSPLAISVKLYEFLNIPLHKSLASYIAIHTEMDKFSKFYLAKQDYFSTYRKSSYNYNSWMTNMNTIKRQEIEKHCSDVIKLLGYNLTSRKTFD